MMPASTLILDGIFGRPRRFAAMRRVIEQAGGTTEIFHYDCSGAGCLEAEGRKLAETVRRRGEPVNIIGFSMGGLVARAAGLADPEIAYGRAVFINSPHAGSWLACMVPFRRLLGIRQMRPGSDLLRRLNAAPWSIPTLAVWCPLDLAIIPGHSARWPRAQHFIRSDVPVHSWAIHSPMIQRRVAEFLQ